MTKQSLWKKASSPASSSSLFVRQPTLRGQMIEKVVSGTKQQLLRQNWRKTLINENLSQSFEEETGKSPYLFGSKIRPEWTCETILIQRKNIKIYCGRCMMRRSSLRLLDRSLYSRTYLFTRSSNLHRNLLLSHFDMGLRRQVPESMRWDTMGLSLRITVNLLTMFRFLLPKSKSEPLS